MRSASTIGRLKPLLIAAVAVIALPFLLRALGLSLNTGTWMLGLAIAAMGLNLCIGYTGLVSFGHSTWFGIGAYAAGLIQLRFFPGEIWLPLLLSTVIVAIASTLIGIPVTSHTFKPKLLTGSILSASLELQYSPAAKYHPMWRFPSTFDAGFNRQSRVQ